VEVLNSLLRNAGLAAHCTWIPAVQDISDALEQLNPELLVCIEPTAKDLKAMAAVRDLVASTVPLIVVRDQPSATAAARTCERARDTVAIGSVAHLTAVMRRELRAFRMERTLTTTLRSAQDYRRNSRPCCAARTMPSRRCRKESWCR